MTGQEYLGKGYHLLAKPIGPLCNLNCQYCFYTEKSSFFPAKENYRMTDQVLEAFIKEYISQDLPEIQFVWQGGEPSLLGLEFFRKAVGLQKKYARGKKIINSFQTNGVLLNEDWCRFFKANAFLVGLSLDGPREFHDRYRFDHAGKPTFDSVLKNLSLLKKYNIQFNVLVCVTRESSKHPQEVYHFLKEQKIKYIQFTPIVERIPSDSERKQSLKHASPPLLHVDDKKVKVTPYSVISEEYGHFLIEIFEEWVRNDVGSVFIMNFEWALESWLGLDSTICIFSKNCGQALAIEHNGAIYSCDHYVYPDYLLGNILNENPKKMLESKKHQQFSYHKKGSLPNKCLKCEALFACNGECPRHRFLQTPDGEPGLSYLCEGYYKYFRHIHRYMKVMVKLIENGLPAADVMEAIKGPLYIYNKKK